MNIGVVRRTSVDEDQDPLFEVLRRFGWQPQALTVQSLNIAAREDALAGAVVEWPDEQPDWLKGVCDRMAVVTLHTGLNPEDARTASSVGVVACFDGGLDPGAWVPSLAPWVAMQTQRLATLRREREQRGTLADARAISAAVGLLAQRHQTTIDQAFATLRNQARAQRKRLEVAANEILDAHKDAIGRGT